MSEEKPRFAIMSQGNRNRRSFREGMETAMVAIQTGKPKVEIEWVDCARITELESQLKECEGVLHKVRYHSVITPETGPLIRWASDYFSKRGKGDKGTG